MSQRRSQILLFGHAATVGPRRGSNSPEIEANRGQAGSCRDLDGADHDRIVHIPAVQGVRVTDRNTCQGGVGTGYSGVENDAGLRQERHGLFGYHRGMRIRRGTLRVQHAC